MLQPLHVPHSHLDKNLHCLHQNWIQFYCHSLQTLIICLSLVYQVLNVNWSAFLKRILLTLQSHDWNNGTNGGCQLGSGDLGLPHWFCGPLVCHWLLCGRRDCSWGVPNESFCHLPPHPSAHPTSPPLLSIPTAERDDKKYEIQPSELEKVSYNKNQ